MAQQNMIIKEILQQERILQNVLLVVPCMYYFYRKEDAVYRIQNEIH